MDFRDIKEFIIDSLKYIGVIAIFLIIAIFVVSFQQVVGPSMSGTLEEGDVLIISKLNYKIGDPKRGEIVTLEQDEKIMVKRIIGLPGEYIEYKDNKLYIDGEAYDDAFANSKTDDFKLEDIGLNKIPKDCYFVLGDNRSDSMDSRDYGCVKKENIYGKAIMRLFPFNKIKML